MSQAEILALHSGWYSNTNKITNGNLPTSYGVLLVFKTEYYKLLLYFPTTSTAMYYSTPSPAATGIEWRQLGS